MITTLLLDLDDTLLDNDMGRFIPAYLQCLGTYLADVAPQERLIAELMRGTQAMINNKQPTKTLEQVFAEHFYPALGITREALRPRLQYFYNEVFPSLRDLTRPRTAARRLVESGLAEGLKIVIATDPLFPRLAVEQRLAWASLPADRYPFALLTSYECFHFSKPHLAYYAEGLARLGKPPHEAAMIGDNPINDLNPARALGMAVFRIGTNGSSPYRSGDLDDALLWLADAGREVDPTAVRKPEVVLARLRGNLAALLSMTAEIDGHTWQTRPAPDDWAPVEIVSHLRDVELEVNRMRFKRILAERNPFLSAVDPDRWADERGYLHQSGPESVRALTQSRLEWIDELENIDKAAWGRTARHSLIGPTTLAEVLSVATEHELLHLDQLIETLARDGEQTIAPHEKTP